MAISEAQLETWGKQGRTRQFTATYETLRGVLDDTRSPYYPRDFTIFLQGSYKNDTNVYGDSDVDVVIRLNETFYTDLGQLSEEDKAHWNAAKSDANYSLADFKSEMLAWLNHVYGSDVDPGSKAIFIEGNGTRRDADVLVCAELWRFHRFKDWTNKHYDEGICFFRSDGTRIDSFPKQHSDNCTQKHQDTKNWFKHTARIFKNLRNTMVDKGIIDDDMAPSYFLEGLLYNVPDAQYGGSEQQNFQDVLSWLINADRSKFVCANEKYYLFHPTSPVTWRAEKCTEFLSAAADY